MSDRADVLGRQLSGAPIGFEIEAHLLALVELLIPARSTAEMWTKTSLDPSSGWMKP
jgi:hypothetical protein